MRIFKLTELQEHIREDKPQEEKIYLWEHSYSEAGVAVRIEWFWRRPAYVPMSLRARNSVLGTCKGEKMIGIDQLGIYRRIWSDSSGYDTSDISAVGSPYSRVRCILILVASDFSLRWLPREFVLCVYSVLSAFSDRGIASRQPPCVNRKLYIAAWSGKDQPTVSEVAGSVRSNPVCRGCSHRAPEAAKALESIDLYVNWFAQSCSTSDNFTYYRRIKCNKETMRSFQWNTVCCGTGESNILWVGRCVTKHWHDQAAYVPWFALAVAPWQCHILRFRSIIQKRSIGWDHFPENKLVFFTR